jgi:hypothetical protein
MSYLGGLPTQQVVSEGLGVGAPVFPPPSPPAAGQTSHHLAGVSSDVDLPVRKPESGRKAVGPVVPTEGDSRPPSHP